MSLVEVRSAPKIEPRKPGRRNRSGKGGHTLVARGEPMIWLTGGGLALCILMIVGLLALIFWQGIGTFWPGPVIQVRTLDGQRYMGELAGKETFRPEETVFQSLPNPEMANRARQAVGQTGGVARRRLIRTGNFELTNSHFNWVSDFMVAEEVRPEWALVVERQAWGRFYGTPVAFEIDGNSRADSPEAVWALYNQYHDAVRDRWRQRRRLETHDIGEVNRSLEEARLKEREEKLRYGDDSPQRLAAQRASREREVWAKAEYDRLTKEIHDLDAENTRYGLVLQTVDGKRKRLGLADIVRAYPANRLSGMDRLGLYASRWWEFLTDEPREANSEGGVFPAIFGTVLMTLLMSVVVVPLGVLAALYLREYAKRGLIVSAVRIAINNLAGVPSIVFGVFGLGFLCYGVGGFIDAGPSHPWPRWLWLFAGGALVLVTIIAVSLGLAAGGRPSSLSRTKRLLARLAGLLWVVAAAMVVLLVAKMPFFEGSYRAGLPNPTFGKGALIWASLTLALMTLPVVIVATEEALAAVPNSMREGSYACGASKWQTIKRIVLPRAMPGIMTGMILAMARGAGEVAPLMLVGAVKLAPELPIAAAPPFGVNRSFMHLGFHIYDLGFQSQNSEAAKPMVFTTTLLLIVIIAAMNLAAVWLRTRLRRKFVSSHF